MDNLEAKLDRLEEDGFILVENALTPEETEHVRQRINHARAMGWEEGLNAVGNMWFDSLLDREPETYAPLVGHPSIRPILEGMMGRQCQLRSFRAHINPGPYLQEWHLDFYGYWAGEARDRPRPLRRPAGRHQHHLLLPGQRPRPRAPQVHQKRPTRSSRPTSTPWTAPNSRPGAKPRSTSSSTPKPADCIVFINHIPHQGAKHQDHIERSNVVCHYQVTPMYEGIWHVSTPAPATTAPSPLERTAGRRGNPGR